MSRNITLAVPDEVYRRARVHAAKQGTSVSALVREYLESLTDDDTEFQRLLALQNEALEEIWATSNFSASDRLPRDELYDRGRD